MLIEMLLWVSALVLECHKCGTWKDLWIWFKNWVGTL